MPDYRNVYSSPESPEASPAQILEFRSSPETAVLDRLMSEVVALVREVRAEHQELVRYIAEQRGAMARIQIPSPHVNVKTPPAPNVDVQVDAPAPPDVIVNVPEAQVTVTPIQDGWKKLKIRRTEQGFIDEIERVE